MNTRVLARSLCLLAAASVPCVVSARSAGAAASPETPAHLAQPLEAWRALHGPTWQIVDDPGTGFAQMLYGGNAAPSFEPRDDAQFIDLAISAVTQTRALLGVDASSLVPERALFLPLGQIGSSDKVTVRLHQAIGGVPVVGGYVNVLFDTHGKLLSVQTSGLPGLSSFDVRPGIDADAARRRAAETFRADVGITASSVSTPALVIVQVERMKGRRGVLAWQVDARADLQDALPEGYTYWLDARTGAIVQRESSIKTFDVTGTVVSNATPGLAPDVATNPPTQQPMKYLTVTSGSGNATTDAIGHFTIPGVNSPLSVTFTYNGTFNHVLNNTGANYTLTQTLQPNQANTIVMNTPAVGTVTAQANAFNVVDHLRDWVRSVNPNDSTADFVVTSNTNLAQTCNAYYDGVSLNFYAPGGGCPNTAYSTVISHENGHWLNDLYGTGNGSDGMGEGNADVWSMYSWETPIIAQDFFGPGTDIRTGLNTRQFCGDCCGGCYGEVHADGEVWMGAAWKVRAHLQTTNGSASGSLIANDIFLGWMEGYNQTQIKSVILTQWLTLDDNDGNIGNGTPHLADINQGFVDQGFPPFIPPFITYGPVTSIPDQSCEGASYPVTATINANAAPPISSATLLWRANGGAFNSVPMTNTSGNDWTGSIPHVASPVKVDYYVTATDSAAHTRTYPDNAPTALLGFIVGTPIVLFSDDFESATDNGWTHGTVGDTSNPEDEWQHGTPLGRSGTSFGVQWTDPGAAASGTRCWGIDLGIGGSDGAYSPNVHPYLRSPVINCSSSIGTQLRFNRWLTCEQGIYDHARILVNGTQVWTNPQSGNFVDTAWSSQTVDISSIADGNASVTIQFDLQSDPGLELGGWQIDDVTLLRYVAAPPCCGASNYCVTTPNSAGPGATIGWSGTTSIAANNFVLTAAGCPANKLGLFIYGPNQSSLTLGNGIRCVGNPFFRLHAVTTTGAGTASYPVNYNTLPVGQPITAGSIENFQFWFRDPAAGGGNSDLSNGLNAQFCP
jgi:hypothetical protein